MNKDERAENKRQRRAELKLSGLCQCGRPPVAGNASCQFCLARYRRARRVRVEERRCIRCATPLLMGETTRKCRNCSEETFQFNW